MRQHVPWSNRRVLVTGGAGFIGSHIAEELLRADASVTVVDDLFTGSTMNLERAQDAELVKMRVGTEDFDDFLRKRAFDNIFHFAGNGYVPPSVEDPVFDLNRNLLPTVRLLECVRRSKLTPRIVFASSAAVYGDASQTPICDDAPLDPISPYGVSKTACDRYIAVYARLYGIHAASVRLFSVYGPRQTKQVVYDLTARLYRDRDSLTLFGDGTQERDFTYVTDVARAALAVGQRGDLNGETYNVASGETISIRQLARTIADALGLNPEFRFTGAVRPGDPERWSADTSRLKLLEFRPDVTFREGIDRTVAWFIDHAEARLAVAAR